MRALVSKERLSKLLELDAITAKSDKHHAQTLISQAKYLCIYGHGAGFIPVKNTILDRLNIKPVYILDERYKNGPILEKSGTILSNLEYFSIKEQVKSNFVVIVSVGTKNLYEDIRKSLEKIGIHSIIWAPDIYEFNIHHESGRMEYDPSLILSKKSEILKAYSLLQDEESQNVFLSLLEIYISHTPLRVPARPIDRQYFPDDIFNEEVYGDFINCGAFTGDTVKNLVKNIGKIKKITCIEPDQSSFLELVDYSRKHSTKIADQIQLLPVALGNKTQKISFKSSLGLCSEVGEGMGADSIQCVRLDDILPIASPTYLSMDLEGYEVMALAGAEQMITRAKPNLAISIYHQINHLWEIILKIDGYQLGYEFYLRNYTGFTYETILYCKK